MEHKITKLNKTAKILLILQMCMMCIGILYIIYDIYSAQYLGLAYWVVIIIINWFGYRYFRIKQADAHNQMSHMHRRGSRRERSDNNNVEALSAALSALFILPFKK